MENMTWNTEDEQLIPAHLDLELGKTADFDSKTSYHHFHRPPGLAELDRLNREYKYYKVKHKRALLSLLAGMRGEHGTFWVVGSWKLLFLVDYYAAKTRLVRQKREALLVGRGVIEPIGEKS